MNRKMISAAAAAFLCGAMAIATAAQAAVTITFRQVGSDVVSTGGGALNINGLVLFASNSDFAANVSGPGAIAFVGTGHDPIDIYQTVSGPAFGNGSRLADSGSGDLFGVDAAEFKIVVPYGYISGTTLSGSATYSGRSIASLGLIRGSYDYVLPFDVLTVQIAGVPEPASWAMLGLGFGALGAAVRQSRRRGNPALAAA